MPHSFEPNTRKLCSPKFAKVYRPLKNIMPETPILESRGDKPLKMTFEDLMKALIFFHLEEHTSGSHLKLRCSKKMTSRIKILLQRTASKKAHSLKR